MKLKHVILAGALALAAQYSQAALLIEPVVGYSMGGKSTITDDEDGTKTTLKGGSGLSYGGRLGYQNMGFQIGLDYLKSDLGYTKKDSFKDSVDTSEWAGFIGFQFPVLFRVYAGYIFSATANTPVTDSDDGSKYKASWNGGTGPKFGVGFTLLPLLDINLEYRKVSFDEWKVAGEKFKDKTDNSVFMLALSVPFTI
jgi:hypothetical protein